MVNFDKNMPDCMMLTLFEQFKDAVHSWTLYWVIICILDFSYPLATLGLYDQTVNSYFILGPTLSR